MQDSKPQKTLRLWTIQPLSIYEDLLKHGEVSTFGSEIANDDPKHLLGYQWIINQMNKRIGLSPSPGQYPIWAWYQWIDHYQAKPDMRIYHLPKGEKHVRLTLEIPLSELLLSDFIEWNNVFSYQTAVMGDLDYIKSIPEDELQYLNEADDLFPDLPKPHQDFIVRSWENIFIPATDKLFQHILIDQQPWHDKRIQATFWTLKLSHVKKVEYFTGRH